MNVHMNRDRAATGKPANTKAGRHLALVAELHACVSRLKDDSNNPESYADIVSLMRVMVQDSYIHWTDVEVECLNLEIKNGGFDRCLVAQS